MVNTVLVLVAALSATDLLHKSIRYHDPTGALQSKTITLELSETRPNGTNRETTIVIDNARGRFEMTRSLADGTRSRIVTQGDEVIESGDLEPERALRTRNYYIYLYGLPVKLLDPGTRLDPRAKETDFRGHPAFELKVTYDESVGSDTWYFYLDRETYALIGYRFYHDESKNDGEYITLAEEAAGSGLKLPRIRTWYLHQGDGLLGTDTIESIRVQ